MTEKLLSMLELQETLNNNIDINWRSGINTNLNKKIDFILAMVMESAEIIDSFPWKHWKALDAKIDYENIKIEIVDIFHFLISHLMMSYKKEKIINIFEDIKKYYIPKINLFKDNYPETMISETKNFIKLCLNLDKESKVYYEQNIELIKKFFLLMELNNMSFEELYQLYIGKNVLNKIRQDNGYKEGTYQKLWGIDKLEDNVVLTKLLKENEYTFDELYKELTKKYKSN